MVRLTLTRFEGENKKAFKKGEKKKKKQNKTIKSRNIIIYIESNCDLIELGIDEMICYLYHPKQYALPWGCQLDFITRMDSSV